MAKDYEMVTVAAYFDKLNTYSCSTVTEVELESKVSEYIKAQQRKEYITKRIEELLA